MQEAPFRPLIPSQRVSRQGSLAATDLTVRLGPPLAPPVFRSTWRVIRISRGDRRSGAICRRTFGASTTPPGGTVSNPAHAHQRTADNLQTSVETGLVLVSDQTAGAEVIQLPRPGIARTHLGRARSQRRAREAAALLRETDLQIGEIAERIGLSRMGLRLAFRNEYGMTPREYRRAPIAPQPLERPQPRRGRGRPKLEPVSRAKLAPEPSPEQIAAAERKLAELATVVNDCYQATFEPTRTELAHAIECGLALTQARTLCFELGRGKWSRWLKERVEFSVAHAGKLIRVAGFRELLAQHPDVLSLHQAERRLKELNVQPWTGKEQLPRERYLEMQRYARRHGVAPACRKYGVSEVTMTRYRDGKFPMTAAERADRAAHLRRQRSQDQLNKQIPPALRRKGDAASRLYAMVERMQDVLADAHRDEPDPQAREHYAKATALYHELRDLVVRAVLTGSR